LTRSRHRVAFTTGRLSESRSYAERLFHYRWSASSIRRRALKRSPFQLAELGQCSRPGHDHHAGHSWLLRVFPPGNSCFSGTPRAYLIKPTTGSEPWLLGPLVAGMCHTIREPMGLGSLPVPCPSVTPGGIKGQKDQASRDGAQKAPQRGRIQRNEMSWSQQGQNRHGDRDLDTQNAPEQVAADKGQ
jgi:hypothetical protein